MLEVRIKKLDNEGVIPSYSLEGDAGLDLVSIGRYYDDKGNVVHRTGLSIEIPEGYVGLLFPRSSICNKQQTLTNSVGVIDSNYRGELLLKFKPTLEGHSHTPDMYESNVYEVGNKIAQLIILPYPKIKFVETEQLSSSVRMDYGFGSTGN